MKLLNDVNDSNFITKDESSMHTIKKYEFRNMDKALEAQIAPAMEVSGIYTPKEESQSPKIDEDLQEKLEQLLAENQKIQESLSLLQNQIQVEQSDTQAQTLDELKKSSYNEGYLQAKQDLQEEMQKSLDEEKEKMICTIENLNATIQDFQNESEKIKQELSVIALDLAKEVIIKEVEENSAKIALLVANELLKPIIENSDIVLRANPLDLPFLQERLVSNAKITFKADALVARGGVIISSSSGNFDGTILSRYRNLKRSILDEKGL